jgi:hypothetical protein
VVTSSHQLTVRRQVVAATRVDFSVTAAVAVGASAVILELVARNALNGQKWKNKPRLYSYRLSCEPEEGTAEYPTRNFER